MAEQEIVLPGEFSLVCLSIQVCFGMIYYPSGIASNSPRSGSINDKYIPWPSVET